MRKGLISRLAATIPMSKTSLISLSTQKSNVYMLSILIFPLTDPLKIRRKMDLPGVNHREGNLSGGDRLM